MEIIKLLVDQLGVTENQAQGGAGAIFNMVKDKVSDDQFSNLSSAIPGLDSLMAAAPDSGGGLSGAIGGLTSMLGGEGAEKLGNLAGLAGSFDKLGLDMDSVTKFIPIILSFVQSKGGDTLKDLLTDVLS
jgi:hypothetical protein